MPTLPSFLFGSFSPPWWGYVMYTLIMTHITIAAVTIFLHRHQAHHALKLHPSVSHFFRFWLWLTTGMTTKAWAAIHRKHHACVETEDDPHSPQVLGLRTVLLEGAELYKKEARNLATIERYGHGTPDDWLEHKLYSRHTILGLSLMFVIDFVLFGFMGIAIWAVQMAWIPLLAAGVINGIGHYWGYRRFACNDASRNIVPWGILIGGEELHNNHHAYATSARLSNAGYEFDIGWLYIRVLEELGLATDVERPPQVIVDPKQAVCNAETAAAVISDRLRILHRFQSLLDKYAKYGQEKVDLIQSFRNELVVVWENKERGWNMEQAANWLQAWCEKAQKASLPELKTLARRLAGYRLKA